MTAPPPPAKPEEPQPPSINDYDELIANEVARFVKQSQELGGLVAEQVSIGGYLLGGQRATRSTTAERQLTRFRGSL